MFAHAVYEIPDNTALCLLLCGRFLLLWLDFHEVTSRRPVILDYSRKLMLLGAHNDDRNRDTARVYATHCTRAVYSLVQGKVKALKIAFVSRDER